MGRLSAGMPVAVCKCRTQRSGSGTTIGVSKAHLQALVGVEATAVGAQGGPGSLNDSGFLVG